MSVYREFAPGAGLGGDVRCVWTYEGEADNEPQRIAPDGCCELIVHVGDPYTELPAERAQPAILFAGQLTAPLTIVARGRAGVLGVRFTPDGARGFLGGPIATATDKRVNLTEAHGELLARVRRAASWDERIVIAKAYVAARAAPAEPIVRAAVQALGEGGEAEYGALSERQFQRRFKDRVGVAPRTFAAIVRFRRVFEAIEHPETKGWVEAALRAGYFDQPQMARDFRRFLGCTARDWAAQRAGLAVALTMSEPYKIAGDGGA